MNGLEFTYRLRDQVSDKLGKIEGAMNGSRRAARALEATTQQAMAKMGRATEQYSGTLPKLRQRLEVLRTAKEHTFDPAVIRRLNAEIARTERQLHRLDTAQPRGLRGSFTQMQQQVPVLGQALGLMANPLALAAAGTFAVGSAMASAVRTGMEYEDQLADLSALTGITGDGLNALGRAAQRQAERFGGSAAANIESFKNILGALGPEIAQNTPALDAMATAVNTLSKTMGGDVLGATNALTSALNQYGVDLSDPLAASREMARMMNVMAAGAQAGAAEVPDIAAAIAESGAMAHQAGLSFEELNGAIQTLATRSIKGAEAGTAMRNILIKLGEARFIPRHTLHELQAAGVNVQRLADTTLPLAERLKELNKIQHDSALVAKLFGSENIVAAQALLTQQDRLAKFTQQVTGTNTAVDMAAVRMNTLGERMGRLKSRFDNVNIAVFERLKPILSRIVGWLEEATAEGGSLNGVFQTLGAILEPIASALGAIFGAIGRIIGKVVEWIGKSELLRDIFTSIGWVIEKVGEVIAWVLDKLGDAFGGIFELLDKLYKGAKLVWALMTGDTHEMARLMSDISGIPIPGQNLATVVVPAPGENAPTNGNPAAGAGPTPLPAAGGAGHHGAAEQMAGVLGGSGNGGGRGPVTVNVTIGKLGEIHVNGAQGVDVERLANEVGEYFTRMLNNSIGTLNLQ